MDFSQLPKLAGLSQQPAVKHQPDNRNVSDLTVDELKTIIRAVVAQEMHDAIGGIRQMQQNEAIKQHYAQHPLGRF